MSETITIPTLTEHTHKDAPALTSNANTRARCNALDQAATRPQGRKRKRDTDTSCYESQSRPFLIRCPQEIGDEAFVSISPQFLLPRLHLPLSFLDTNQPVGALTLPRIFNSNIQPLEDIALADSTLQGPLVLVASIGSLGCLCAIERVQPRSYSLIKLGSWISFDDLHKHAVTLDRFELAASKTRETNDRVRISDVTISSPDVLANDTETRECALKSDYNAVADRVDLREKAGSNCVSVSNAASAELLATQQSLTEPPHVDRDRSIASILHHYLETLYVTQTPLAYFAKGPISRARAAFGVIPSSAHQADELCSRLKQFMFSIKLLDTKHQQSLPTAAKSFLASISFLNGSNMDSSESPRLNTRKIKRTKPDKNGFLPEETAYVKRWCMVQGKKTTDTIGQEKIEGRISQGLSKIKTREYLLQLIIILECLSLHVLGRTNYAMECGKPNQQGQTSTEKKTAASNKQDATTKSLLLNMEVLLDRLSIWQSLNTERQIQDSETRDVEPVAGVSCNEYSSSSSDILQEFCTDVVIPFYQSRIPSVTKDVMKKMGVTLKSPAIKKSKFVPGQTVKPETHRTRMKKEVANTKQRNPLKRVASDTPRTCEKRPPTLNRFLTDPLLQEVNRERNITPQSLHDLQQRARRPLSRASSISHGNGIGHREVDFSSITKFKQSKHNKKPNNWQAELKDAIETLKKPNRDLAIKEFFDTQENVRSRPATEASERPPKVLSYRKLPHDAQVEATPKRIQKSKPEVILTPSEPSIMGSRIAAKSEACVSSSAEKPSPCGVADSSRSIKHVTNMNTGEEQLKKDSASRASMPLSRRLQYGNPVVKSEKSTDGYSGCGNLHRKRLQPTKIAEPGDVQPTSQFFISATPSKPTHVEVVAEGKENLLRVSSLSKGSFEAKSNNPCIYDALGWNEDFDELM